MIKHESTTIFIPNIRPPLVETLVEYQKPHDKAIFNIKLTEQMLEEVLKLQSDSDVSDPDRYIEYLESKRKEHLQKFGHFANKANVQLECQKLGINEDTTRMIDPSDLGTLFRYVKKLTDAGRIVWIGSSTGDDMTDPNSDKSKTNHSVTPPLYKKITSLDDLMQIIPSINVFRGEHPDMLLKVFPQDGKSPTLTSLVFENSNQSKKISFHFKPGQFTPDGLRNDKPSKTIDVEVDLSCETPIIMIDDETDLDWVKIVLNSLDIFKKAQGIDYCNSPIINIEAMHLNGNSSLSFITDIVYGNGRNDELYEPVPFVAMLKSLKRGLVVYKNSSTNIKSILSDPNNLIRVLMDKSTYTPTPQNQRSAKELLDIISYLDLDSQHINIPPSIIRSLQSISTGIPTSIPISKAILHLQNSIFIPFGGEHDDRRLYTKPNLEKNDGWNIVNRFTQIN